MSFFTKRNSITDTEILKRLDTNVMLASISIFLKNSAINCNAPFAYSDFEDRLNQLVKGSDGSTSIFISGTQINIGDLNIDLSRVSNNRLLFIFKYACEAVALSEKEALNEKLEIFYKLGQRHYDQINSVKYERNTNTVVGSEIKTADKSILENSIDISEFNNAEILKLAKAVLRHLPPQSLSQFSTGTEAIKHALESIH